MSVRSDGETLNGHRVTIVDVARLAGVSVASASKVVRGTSGVSEEMRGKVNNAVAKLGYRPHRMAQGLRGPLKTIGVLLPGGIDSPFFAALSNGAVQVLSQSGYEVFISPAGLTAKSHYTAMESLIDHRMGGLLLVAPLGATSRLEEIASQIPIVVIGRHGENARYDTIAGDDALGTQLIVQHLVDSGHHRITFFASQDEGASDLPQHVRLQGYRTAMAAHGLHNAIDVVTTEWSYEGGAAAAKLLLSRDELPDAVIAGPDVTALGFLGEAWARGIRTPDDLAVVGYDNIPMSAWPPLSLTTVDQSGFEMGRIAAQMLLERIEGRAEVRHETLPVSLVPRRTSGA
jgi:LacI family transcriptional regulator